MANRRLRYARSATRRPLTSGGSGRSAESEADHPRLTSGTCVGPYRIGTLIGRGGMGEVYRARDMWLGRDVALKVLPSDSVGHRRRATRFDDEARALAALHHPNIGGIHAIVDEDGVRGLVLEYISGPTLATKLLSGPLPLAETLSIARQIAEALSAAHSSGIVHRDLKPANLKITPDGVVKVLDFGIARLHEQAGPTADAPTMSLDASDEGRVTGTTAYMSPEQTRGKAVDRRTDIWAFGCVLFEMLTGRRAFGGDTTSDTIVAILERQPDLSTLPRRMPSALRRLLSRCLQKDPARRLQDISDAQFDLDEARAESAASLRRTFAGLFGRYRARPTQLAMHVVLLLAGAALCAWWTWLVASAAVDRAHVRPPRADDRILATIIAAPLPDAVGDRVPEPCPR